MTAKKVQHARRARRPRTPDPKEALLAALRRVARASRGRSNPPVPPVRARPQLAVDQYQRMSNMGRFIQIFGVKMTRELRRAFVYSNGMRKTGSEITAVIHDAARQEILVVVGMNNRFEVVGPFTTRPDQVA